MGALIGPFVMPSLAQVREAVTTLTQTYPDSRLNWCLDATGRRWQATRTAEAMVSQAPSRDHMSVGEALDAIVADNSLDPPLSLIRFPNYLGLRMSHGIGDGRVFSTILAAVLHTAMTSEVRPWPLQPGGRAPLATAVCLTFGRHPSLVRAAVADRYAKDRGQAPASTLPWTPSRRTIAVPIKHSDFDEMNSVAANAGQGSNRFAAQVCSTLTALRAVGLNVSRDVNLVVDLRRYLGWRFIDGNFLAGVPVRVGPDMAREQVAATIRATVRSGRPLATQMLSSMRSGGANSASVRSVDPDGAIRVTFSGLPTPEFNDLPFLPGHNSVVAGSVEPDGPLGLTFLMSQMALSTWISASFHDNVIDAAAVERALRLVASDPAGILRETGRGS
ncbi:hypothetical protein E4P42_06000 [Mycobacterium sp. PS03-16]|uniref:hypothetical protein n=1 Tax=Mycobacterium sp. PS03-16 TaxID=2559611 RepID=UPI001073E56A|nr:hypothetical protein [Mycobacterium sp. PS03-16]TFV59925.1 hypothetical protein E4P42_06000 [Mycobacterium sp. PS03-16]